MTNCNELSLSSSIKTHQSHTTLNLKPTIVYFIITCDTKIVHVSAVSSVVRGYHKCNDVWNAHNDGAELPCEREPSNPIDTYTVVALFGPSGKLTIVMFPD